MSPRLAFALSLSLLPSAALAVPYNVPADHPTVREAALRAKPGDEILVDAGLYDPTLEDFQTLIPLSHGVTVRGIHGRPEIPGFEIPRTAAGEAPVALENLAIRASLGADEHCAVALWTEVSVAAEQVDFLPFADPFPPSNAAFVDGAHLEVREFTASGFGCEAPFTAIHGASLELVDGTIRSRPGFEGSFLGAVLADGAARTHLERVTVSDIVASAGIVVARGGELTVLSSEFMDNVLLQGFGSIIEHDGGTSTYLSEVLLQRNEAFDAVVHVQGIPDVQIVDGRFEENRSSSAGSLAAGNSQVQIFGTTFDRTVAQHVWLGDDPLTEAEISVWDSQLSLVGSRIRGPDGTALSAVFSTLDLQDVSIEDARSPGEGGALALVGTEAVVQDSVFLGNRARWGGSVYLAAATDLLLVNTLLDGTTTLPEPLIAEEGGHIYIAHVEASSSFTALDSRIVHGEAVVGSALASQRSSHIQLQNTVIQGNRAELGTLLFGPGDKVVIDRSEIRENTATSEAVFLGQDVQSLDLRCSKVCGNQSHAVHLASLAQKYADSAFRMRNNAWFGNQIGAGPAPAPNSQALWYVQTHPEGTLEIVNNTFVDDLAEVQLFLAASPVPVNVTNNIFAGATHAYAGAYDLGVVDYNLYHDTLVPADWSGPNAIFDAPVFDHYPSGAGCDDALWLTLSSPGFQQGRPDLHDVSDVAGAFPSSVGAYGGPEACLTDEDGDGWTADLDCDDADETRHPEAPELCDGVDNDCDGLVDDDDDLDPSAGTIWYFDADKDGFGDPATAVRACDSPGVGWTSVGGDCDDLDADIHPDALEICDGIDNDCDDLVDDEDDSLDPSSASLWLQDLDEDGFGGETAALACLPPDDGTAWVEEGGDCDDQDDQIHPDATEVCDGIDNDCDDLIDDEDDSLDPASVPSWFQDGDGDGFGAGSGIRQCAPPGEGWVTHGDDCDDANDQIHPDATEICDGIDNDCDDLVDDDDPSLDRETELPWYPDADADGYGMNANPLWSCAPPADGDWADNPDDCDDFNDAVYPGAPEICDGIDNDCDQLVDDDDELDASVPPWYADDDEDGYGDLAVISCAPPQAGNWVRDGGDCDDEDSAVHPGATEICDGIDNDCDDLVDDADPDLDLGTASAWYLDSDGDDYGAGQPQMACQVPGPAWVANGGDCDDADSAIHPNATEICDGIDNDCDELIDDADPDLDLGTASAWYLDADGDDYGAGQPQMGCDAPGPDWVLNGDDCDDADSAIHPAAPEICDDIDNDCDGLIDDADPDRTGAPTWYADGDGDGFGAGQALEACVPPNDPQAWVGAGGDCDDADDAIHPGAAEICDGLDNDCDELVDDADPDLDASSATTWYADRDGDGFGDAEDSVLACEAPAGWVADASDCNDGDPALTDDCATQWAQGGCACDATGNPAAGWLAVLGALLVLRRQQR